MISGRRWGWISLLMPLASLALIVFVYALPWPHTRHPPAYETTIMLLALVSFPLTVVASIVMAIVAVVRARREGSSRTVPKVAMALSALWILVALLLASLLLTAMGSFH